MPKTLIRPYYQNLLNEISTIYTDSKLQARNELNKILTKAYWEIGKRIVTVEQDNELRAQYGGRLLERLSSDLTEMHGEGFSHRNLYRMRQLYETYKISPPVAKLEWSKLSLLLGVKDSRKRLQYEDLAISENWSRAKLIEALKSENLILAPKTRSTQQTQQTQKTQLSAKQGPLYTYSAGPGEDGYVYVDVGFSITRQIKSWTAINEGDAIRSLKSGEGFKLSKVRVTPKDLYTYKAYLNRVIDGDTMSLHIDLGFDTFIKETVRLRGINTPEIKTAEGQKAKRFVTNFVNQSDHMIVKTHWEDKYGRYLVDVWIENEYLNQRLLDEGLATGY